MAEADAEQRHRRAADRLGADAEVLGAVGPPGPGRDDDVVEVQLRQLRPARLVVADDRRLLAVHLRQQLEEVVGEGVVVVDQQRLQPAPRLPQWPPCPIPAKASSRPCSSSTATRSSSTRTSPGSTPASPSSSPTDATPCLDDAGHLLRRLRIAVAPDADGQLAATDRAPADGSLCPRKRRAIGPLSRSSLHSLDACPAGSAPHKWADRSLLDEAQAGLPRDALPLIVDWDGAVLEASRANVFAVRDGALLHTPARRPHPARRHTHARDRARRRARHRGPRDGALPAATSSAPTRSS